MKRLSLITILLVLVGLLAGVTACAPKTFTTSQAKVAYTADQIVIRVNELENAAIQANSTGALPVATTKILVEFAVSADKVLKTAPSGWQATVGSAWAEAKKKLPAITNPAVLAAVSAVDLVLANVGA